MKKMEKAKKSKSSNDEDQANARMFASSSNLGGLEDMKKDDDKTQKQHLDIIKNILEMFNLEDTKIKYETQNVLELTLDSNDFGYDCSLSTTRVRQRLCDLMGTDVIRLNDKRYFQKLSQRLEEEYETIIDKQEDARAATENQRLRRLMLEGIIDAPNDYRAVVHGEHKHSAKKTKSRKIKRKSTDRPLTCGSNNGSSTMMSQTYDTEKRNDEVVTQVEILSGSRLTSNSSKSKRRATTPKGRQSATSGIGADDSRPPSVNDMHARPPHHEGALRSSSSCSTNRKSRRVKSAAARLSRRYAEESDESDNDDDNDNQFDTRSLPDRGYTRKPSKYSKQEPERVKNLRTEETVAGLYAIAEEIVSPVRADDKPERKVMPKPKAKKMTVAF